jgi:hypothetical protein
MSRHAKAYDEYSYDAKDLEFLEKQERRLNSERKKLKKQETISKIKNIKQRHDKA